MSSFVLPLYGDQSDSTSKEYKIKSFYGDRVKSPYNGQIVSNTKIGEYQTIEIKHDFNGETIVSKIENIFNGIFGFGPVRQGETIGYYKDTPIIFTVIDRNGKVNISKLLTGGDLTQQPEKKEKEREENISKENEKKYKKPKPTNYEFEKLPPEAQIWADMMSLPGHFLKKGIKSFVNSFTGGEKKETQLREQSERIKDLIKKINK